MVHLRPGKANRAVRCRSRGTGKAHAEGQVRRKMGRHMGGERRFGGCLPQLPPRQLTKAPPDSPASRVAMAQQLAAIRTGG